MKLALIPPLSMPYMFGSDNYKLILPMHWNDQLHFEATMLNHRRGGLTILDNGVAEGAVIDQEHWNELLKIAKRYCVNELVLPDVMGDTAQTMIAVDRVFESTWHHTNHFGLMGVVQGTSVEDCCDLIQYYLGMQGRTLTSIGLPRCLIDTIGVEEARYIMTRYIRSCDENVAIHLLGTNPDHIDELKVFGRNYRALGVRGVDTSAPFVYAAQYQHILYGNSIKRPANYFDMTKLEFDEHALKHNIATLKEWCRG